MCLSSILTRFGSCSFTAMPSRFPHGLSRIVAKKRQMMRKQWVTQMWKTHEISPPEHDLHIFGGFPIFLFCFFTGGQMMVNEGATRRRPWSCHPWEILVAQPGRFSSLGKSSTNGGFFSQPCLIARWYTEVYRKCTGAQVIPIAAFARYNRNLRERPQPQVTFLFFSDLMKFGDFKWEIRTSTTLPVGLLLLKQDGAPPCSACQLMFTLYNYSYIYHKPYRQASEISRIRELGPLGGSTKRRTAHISQRNGLIGPMSWFPAR